MCQTEDHLMALLLLNSVSPRLIRISVVAWLTTDSQLNQIKLDPSCTKACLVTLESPQE